MATLQKNQVRAKISGKMKRNEFIAENQAKFFDEVPPLSQSDVNFRIYEIMSDASFLKKNLSGDKFLKREREREKGRERE